MTDAGTPEGLGAGAATGPREARLRPGAARRYPWIRPAEWQPAAILADRVLAGYLLGAKYPVSRRRVLDDDAFEFRGGSSRRGERAAIRP